MEASLKYNHPDLNNSYEYTNGPRENVIILYDGEGWAAYIYFNHHMSGKAYWTIYEEQSKTTRIE